ncbi:MAG TPA: hypothetical protein VLA12_21820, partial [Planctomycetaceae bacterium]|nr:hypothetical protein [Planctomycetaceae bacterium]
CFSSVGAAEPGLATQAVKATYRLRGEGSMATCFVVSRPDPQAPDKTQRILITAAHVLRKMKGNEATLILRKWNPQTSEYERLPQAVQVRIDQETPQWTEHKTADAGALILPSRADVVIDSLPLELLATQTDFESIEPGQLVRCVGYPHAAHFDPSPPGFALVRLGCIASYPLEPLTRYPSFLVDFNTFEGDSGGLIYLPLPAANGGPANLKILGVIHGQHMLNEKFDLIYQTGETRKRLGVSIVLNAQVIRETIELLPGSK